MHSFFPLLLVLACVVMHMVKVSEAALSPMSGSRLPALSGASLQLRSTVQGLKRSVRESVEDTWADLPLYRSRFPSALKASISAGISSFTSSLGVLFPVAVILSIRPSYPNWASILKTGFFTGLQWSAFSGVFVGGETMAEKLRGRKDRLNSCVGSGLSGALAQYHQGALGMSQGFVSGVAFYYVIDKFMGGKDPFLAMTTVTPVSHSQSSRSAPSSSSKTSRPRGGPSASTKMGAKPSLFSSKKLSISVRKPVPPAAKKPVTPVKKAVPFWQKSAATPARKAPTPMKPPTKKPPVVPHSAASHAHPVRKPVAAKKPFVSQLWPSLPFTSSKLTDGPAAKKATAEQQQRDRERQRKRRSEDEEKRRKKREQEKAAAEALRKKKLQQQHRSRRV